MEVHTDKYIFMSESLSDGLKTEMLRQETWKASCPVSLNRLRLLKISYYDFEGISHNDGEMVVLDAVAGRVLAIFKELYGLKFPIAKIYPIEHYQGNDNHSMADNNSTCFHYREITGGGAISIHSYGLAIDINPHQNPYVNPLTDGKVVVLPNEGAAYLNRTNLRPGMAESVVNIFQDNGFPIWGGGWNTPIDWQHFQPSRAVAQLLALMEAKDAQAFFELYAHSPKMLNTLDSKDARLGALYQTNPQRFMEVLQEHSSILDISIDQALRAIEEEM